VAPIFLFTKHLKFFSKYPIKALQSNILYFPEETALAMSMIAKSISNFGEVFA
jgi:hypothetical protein